MNLPATLGIYWTFSLLLAISPASPQTQSTTAPAAGTSTDAKAPGKTSSHHKKNPSTTCSQKTTSTDAQASCPPAKKVVRNGGSDEPTVQFSASDKTKQAAQQPSTEELKSATEQNLKKISGQPLTAIQQETVAQINQFLEQSKSAIAQGDLDRGHNLALKAQLLSEELVKP